MKRRDPDVKLEPGEKIFEMLIGCDEDVILARQKVREVAVEIGFSFLGQTRVVTAASELARNIAVHAGEGRMSAYKMNKRPGIMLVFEDQGPGIADLPLAMMDGYSSIGSLGLGLQGARKLSDEFDIRTAPGTGTTITLVKWSDSRGNHA
jgi:serine/threonine-protein kinase RsbT